MNKSLTTKEERKLKELHHNKKIINQYIKNLSRKLRILNERTKQHSLQAQRTNHKIHTETALKSQDSIPEHPHLNTQEAGIKQIVDAQNNIRDRNRRLFGGLSSYLKKASSKLEEQAKKVKEKLTLEQKVTQKEKHLTEQFEQNQRKQIEVALEDWNNKKQANAKQILQMENSVLKHKFTTYVSDLQGYLFTKAQPSISWKPSHEDQLFRKQHEQSQLTTKTAASKFIQNITSYKQVFDYSKYISENTMEYYRNYLQNYLQSKQNFFCTKTKPTLLWKPAALNDKLRESLKLSQESLIDEKNDVKYTKVEPEAAMGEEPSQADSESYP